MSDRYKTLYLTDDEWVTVRRALAFHYEKIMKSKSKKSRPSERAMEAGDIFRLYEKVRSMFPVQ